MARSQTFSVELTDVPLREGEGRPRVHPLILNADLMTTYDDRVSTLWDCLKLSVEQSPNSEFVGYRPKVDGIFQSYLWQNRREFLGRIKNFGSGLAAFSLERQTNIGLYSINRFEWLLAEYACYFNDFVTVPLYDTLGDEAIKFICNQTELPIVVATEDKAMNLLRLKENIPSLKTIICMNDEPSTVLQKKAHELNVELIKFSLIEKRGVDHPREEVPPTPDSLCTICYTSGTTGDPKGVMLKHSSIIADVASIVTVGGHGQYAGNQRYFFEIGQSTVHISYLPLAHVYERMVMTVVMAVGGKVGFYQGDVLKIMEDIAELRPTLFVTVPRLLNRIYDKIISGAQAGGVIKKTIFKLALRTKLDILRDEGTVNHWLWDRIVFNAIRRKLGGRLEAIVSASAPLSPDVADFMRVVFCTDVYEAYGQTETCGGSTLTVLGDRTSGHVGAPFMCNEIKLVDISEMDYTSRDQPYPRGEVCIRGPNCFSGYFKAEELTRETVDAEGWIKTGDVGEWDHRGRLRIIDRKKNLFKLSQGEYVAPEKVENVITRNQFVSQAFVEGDSLKPSLVAVLVPDFDNLEPWARDHGIKFNSREELCKDANVKAMLQAQLKSLGREGSNELKGFEIPCNIYLEHVPFSIESNLLTATLKLRRNEAKKYFATQIVQMYANVSL